MNRLDGYFKKLLDDREKEGLKRLLSTYDNLVDFSSNDYLGIAHKYNSGATGSRLISGNFKELEIIENEFSQKIGAENALYFTSGYLANIGLIPCVTDRFSTIFSDELIHASLRDGIRLSHAKNVMFPHNDIDKLEQLLSKSEGKKIIVVETVYSMDGDSPNLNKLFDLVSKFEDAYVILDEAHCLGLSGENNMGIAQDYISHPNCLAIVYPLGKAVGLSGAFVVGSNLLKEFLVNFCRSFIYTTGPSKQLISQLKTQLKELSHADNKRIFHIKSTFLESVNSKFKILSGANSAIVSLVVKEKAKLIEQELKNNQIFVKAIVSPTVAKGTERLRICFHSYNSIDEVGELVKIINSFA